MPEPRGRRLPLSLPRRLIGDLMHFAQKVPTVPVQRCMNVAPLAAAREDAEPRPSWCSIFMRAYCLVAARRPELRRAYLAFPFPHLYEHSINIGSIAIERTYEGEPAVFFAHMRSPEKQTFRQIDSYLRDCKEEPLENISWFRWGLRISRLPRPLRRLLWWWGLNVSGYKRARRLGTFGISVYSALGSDSLHPLSPLTTTINYGVIADSGEVQVRLIYDHRVLDGATIARALAEMEQALNGPILDEVRALAPSQRLRVFQEAVPVSAP